MWYLMMMFTFHFFNPKNKHLAIGFSREEKTTTDDTAKKPLTKGVIRKCFHKNEELIFPIFVWQNHDSTFRFILNLKSLWIASSLISINPITTPNWYLVKIGLKYADCLVPMQSGYRKSGSTWNYLAKETV